jgi:hypothetical protein
VRCRAQASRLSLQIPTRTQVQLPRGAGPLHFVETYNAGALWQRAPATHGERPLLCRFLDVGNSETLGTLGEPASKKRQARSRGKWVAAGSERYGNLM